MSGVLVPIPVNCTVGNRGTHSEACYAAASLKQGPLRPLRTRDLGEKVCEVGRQT